MPTRFWRAGGNPLKLDRSLPAVVVPPAGAVVVGPQNYASQAQILYDTGQSSKQFIEYYADATMGDTRFELGRTATGGGWMVQHRPSGNNTVVFRNTNPDGSVGTTSFNVAFNVNTNYRFSVENGVYTITSNGTTLYTSNNVGVAGTFLRIHCPSMGTFGLTAINNLIYGTYV